jgi:hypothetical protein
VECRPAIHWPAGSARRRRAMSARPTEWFQDVHSVRRRQIRQTGPRACPAYGMSQGVVIVGTALYRRVHSAQTGRGTTGSLRRSH